jgi:hypothetical protein
MGTRGTNKLKQKMPAVSKSKSKNAAPGLRGRMKFTIQDHLSVQQKIEQRAYAFWKQRGCPLLDDLRDWFRAENEVLAEFCAAFSINTA